MKIHAGDTVKVISGPSKGKVARVTKVDHQKGRVTVEGINAVFKHVKRSQRNPQGGRLKVEMPIDASNVMVMCPEKNVPSRVGFRYLEDGTKERYCVKTGVSLGPISPAREAYAQ